jgi:O-antigen ligase/tetratricopeptide (TPR) repeat protein
MTRSANSPVDRFAKYAHLARVVLWLHLLLSPLVFCTATAEAFEENKVALLTLTAVTLAALGLSALAEGGRLRLGTRDPITLGVLLFTASGVVSTVFSISPRTSWRGSPDSHAGLVTLLGYLALFLATRTVCRTAHDRYRLLSAVVVTTALASAYALLQLAKVDPLTWDELSVFAGHVRPFATLGHPNYLGAYLVLTAPFLTVFAEQAWRQARWAAFAGLVLLLAVALVVIVLTLSRAAWLAAVCAAVVLIACGVRHVKRMALVVGLLVLAAAACSLLPWTGVGHSLGDRMRHLGDGAGRWQIWRAAWGLFLDRPVCGWGLDTFQLAFGARRPLDYAAVEWNTTPTRAHNEVLHILATHGLLGAAALGVLLGGFLRALVRRWGASSEDRLFTAAVAASFTGFAVQSVFGFTVVSCGTLFFTCAALLAARWDDKVRTPVPLGSRDLPILVTIRLGLAAGTVVLLWIALVRPFEASTACRAGDRLLPDQPREALLAYQRATTLDPDNARYWTKLSGAAQLAAHTADDGEQQERDLRRALAALERAVALVPCDPFHHANLGRLLGDPACRGWDQIARALEEWDRALALDPHHAPFLLEASRTALALNHLTEARRYAQRGRELYPTWALFHAQLGSCAFVEGRFAEAVPLYGVALQADWHGDEEAITRTLAATAAGLLAQRQLDGALTYALQAATRQPYWPTAHYLLAQTFQARGEYQAARHEYLCVLTLAPQHNGAQAALQRLDTPASRP